MSKVEVQIRSCFCCGLSLAATTIALYALLLFTLLTGLAAWGLWDTNKNGDLSYYNSCENEARGIISADNRKLKFEDGARTIVIVDSTSYHCSLGLYTEEMKFAFEWRRIILVINIVIYAVIVLASVSLLVGLASYFEWLLLPWIFVMCIEIIRGTISSIFIFFLAHWNLARIATGIFFLGLQFFHISIVMIMIAKFQRMYNRRAGNVIDDKDYASRYRESATLPTAYGYSPQLRHPYYSDHSPRGDPRMYGGSYMQPHQMRH